MAAAPRVDAVVVAYNSARTLRACVEPLAAMPGVAVTVVDNASPDDTAAAIEGVDAALVRAEAQRRLRRRLQPRRRPRGARTTCSCSTPTPASPKLTS